MRLKYGCENGNGRGILLKALIKSLGNFNKSSLRIRISFLQQQKIENVQDLREIFGKDM